MPVDRSCILHHRGSRRRPFSGTASSSFCDGVRNIYSARNGARSCDNVCSCNIEGTAGLSASLKLKQLEDIRLFAMLLSDCMALELRASPSVRLEGSWPESSSFDYWFVCGGDVYFYGRSSSNPFLNSVTASLPSEFDLIFYLLGKIYCSASVVSKPNIHHTHAVRDLEGPENASLEAEAFRDCRRSKKDVPTPYRAKVPAVPLEVIPAPGF